MSYTLRPYQAEASAAGLAYLQDPTLKNRNGIIVQPTGCHAQGTQILMHDGSIKAVEDIVVGDLLMGPDGLPRSVLNLCRGASQMFRLTPIRGGDPFVVNDDHVLALWTTADKSNVKGAHTYVRVREYLSKSKYWKHIRKLERAGTIHFGHSDRRLRLPPWILGALLGDGCMRYGTVSICTADVEILREIEDFARAWRLRVSVRQKKNNKACSYYFVKPGSRSPRHRSTIHSTVLDLGLMDSDAGTKFIPNEYKVSSERARLELLAGLIDTDGYHDGVGGIQISTKSPRLADDIAFVARSLGFSVTSRPKYNKRYNRTYQSVYINGDTHRIPCRVKRKRPAKRRQIKHWRVSGFTVDQVGFGAYFGFTLNRDHLYLTADFTIHHNSGKSIVIADIVTKLDGPAIILQPSKEILEQNLQKLAHYGYKAAVFSASMGRKEIGTITLGTIGTVISHVDSFAHLKYVLIDECHVVAANGGMYDEFLIRLSEEGRIRILGLTATPYRLASNSFGSELRFLTRSRPRIFRDMIFETPIRHLVENGYWAPLEYRQRTVVDRTKFKLNTKGSEYTDDSVQEHLFEVGFVGLLQQEVERALDEGRKNVLVFTRFVDESRRLAKVVPGTAVVTAQTPPGERAQILSDYKRGKIRVVSNVGVIALGFDFPELECVILGRPTISLANYYQSVGRAVRTHPAKQYAEIVDMVGLTTLFGKVEDLTLQTGGVRGESWVVCNQDRPLTNVFFHAYGHGSTRLTQQEILKANWRRKFWAKRKKKSLV